MKRKAQLYEVEQTLPKKNSLYLRIILGNVNVSILNKIEKYRYKDEYEKFKLVLSIIGFALSILNLMTNFRYLSYFVQFWVSVYTPNIYYKIVILCFRTLELAFMFLLVWYYCTLTIRESILKVNGSRIKGWWRIHHFISTVCAGVLLVWPITEPWTQFRDQFMWFNTYISK